jgi:hypothetical protein
MGDQVEIIALVETDTHLSVKKYLERCDHGLRVEQASNLEVFRRLISSKKFDCIVSTTESPSVGDVMSLRLTLDPLIPVVLLPQNELEALQDLENYERLAGTIRRRVESSRAMEIRKRNKGCVTPVVVVRENEIYVRGVKDENVLWGYEGSGSIDVAKDIELELRAIDYVRDRLAEAVSEITEELYLSDLAPENVSDIVYEGYMKLLPWFRDLDLSLGHRLGN